MDSDSNRPPGRGLPLLLLPFLFLALLAAPALAAGLTSGWSTPDQLDDKLRSLAGQIPGASVIEYGKSGGNHSLLALRVTRASGDVESLPALLVVGGVEPERLATGELAISLAATAGAKPAEGVDPLASAVLYVIADPAPEARSRVLAGGEGWIGAATDDDKDGANDEDGPEDINGDGRVDWMRIWRTGGGWRADTSDVRASVKADPAGGMPGTFDLVREGKDSDGDGSINEDPAGGAALNAEFPFGWTLFGKRSALFPLADVEARALADFVLAHPHIGSAFVLSGDDNLSEAAAPPAAGGGGGGGGGSGRGGMGGGRGGSPGGGGGGGGGGAAGAGAPKSDAADPNAGALRAALAGGPQGRLSTSIEARPAEERPDGSPFGGDRKEVTTIPDADQPFYDQAASRYRKLVGTARNKETPTAAGSFADWLRFQEGILSVAAPGWSLPDSAQPSNEKGALKALAKGGRNDLFHDWVTITHPDFPDRKVEVGGFDPLYGVVPAGAVVDSLGPRLGAFTRELIAGVPHLEFEAVRATKLDDGLYRVSADLLNSGWLPTALELGVKTRKARPVRAEIEAKSGVTIVGGPPVRLIPTLAGSGGREKIDWIVRAAAGTVVTVRAAAPRAGIARREVTLR